MIRKALIYESFEKALAVTALNASGPLIHVTLIDATITTGTGYS